MLVVQVMNIQQMNTVITVKKVFTEDSKIYQKMNIHTQLSIKQNPYLNVVKHAHVIKTNLKINE